ncbi:ribonuclease E activity regulator RraA [Alkalihalobacillus sp. LMS39]|uniref:ribonuclease E activity regulator RraA n=1 Tax=Alkalihalobacillus sp. LMS39 TaxID=2924032 RepID=UPI001FB56125|nr:ribonuclease E activity regulator RraA [Alkalihalobacillus sp. LMS39]UOE93017.1 ribonuclease E activity regulator RraA [Alkalihalobacillus sp. LMS39]
MSRQFQTADLCDEFRDKLKVADRLFRQYGKKSAFFGPIYTVKVYEDNVLVKRALETIPQHSVLVVDGGGSTRCALMGDNLADIAVKRKLAGVIIYGCIRDSALIHTMDTCILAIGTNPFKSIKKGEGEVQIPLSFAGVCWEPGHYVYADEDGILLSDTFLL